MKRRRYRVILIGAGVAGLTAAIALQRAGHDVTLIERQPKVRALGAGLILWSNAVNAMRVLGLEDHVSDIGYELSQLSILDDRGNRLSSTDTETIRQRTGAPVLAVHRPELLSVLLRHIPDGTLQTDRQFTRFERHGKTVNAIFSDGTAEEGDILVGADGIWSAVREQVHGDQPPRYAGYTAWRAIIDNPNADLRDSRESTESWGAGLRFGWVPLSEGRVYWFAVKNAPEGQSHHERGHREELLRLFGDWHPPIRDTISTTDAEKILRHDIYDRPPIPVWGSGPVTLAGDAAHPMTPNTGQGAAQAIEDAVQLAHCLDRYRTIDGALRAYEASRYPRIRHITELSRRLGAAGQIHNPVITTIRNTVFRATPDRVGSRQLISIAGWKPPESEDPQR